MGMITGALALLRLFSPFAQVSIVLGILIGVPTLLYGAHYAYSTHYINEGRAAMRAEVEAENAELLRGGKVKRDAYDDCVRIGGLWRRETGECVR
jgi:hypothetical protein